MSETSDETPEAAADSEIPELREGPGELLDAESNDVGEALEHVVPFGGLLNPSMAERITRRYPARVIVPVGMASSGKTTLIAVVYELVRREAFPGFAFMASDTLLAFEDRSYLARLTSGRDKPETPRTELTEQPHFLHLALLETDSQSRTDLLLADVSGEQFRMAKDTSADCESLTIMKRADVVVLLLDGDVLSRPRGRASAFYDIEQLVRRFSELEMISAEAVLQTVYTKWDIVRSSAQEESVLRDASSFEQRIEALSGRVPQSLVIAASPKALPSLGLGFGMDSLCDAWLRPLGRQNPGGGLALGLNSDLTSSSREFHRAFAST